MRTNLWVVMAALSQKIPLPTSVEMVEVLVARHALWFAQELGFRKVIVEGDQRSPLMPFKWGQSNLQNSATFSTTSSLFHRIFLRLIFVMLRDLETMLLITLLEELDRLIPLLFGWSLSLRISMMLTTMICFLLNKFPPGYFS